MSRTLAALVAAASIGLAGSHAAANETTTGWQDAVRSAAAMTPALQSLAPSDVSTFCPAFGSLDSAGRSAFWGNLLVHVAETESGGDAARTRWHAFDGAIHRPAFRRGLFQISIEAAHGRRYQCAVGAGAELVDAAVNAACAVNILTAEVAASGSVSGAGRYWPSLANAGRRSALASQTSSEAPCVAAQDAQP